MPAAHNEAILPTLYASYKPVEEYLELLEQLPGAASPADVVRPIDSLTLGLFLPLLPAASVLVDSAGDATCGASTLLCSLHPTVQTVIALRPPNVSSPHWQAVLEHYLAGCARPSSAPVAAAFEGADLDQHIRSLPLSAPVLVLLAAEGQDAAALCRQAAHYLDLHQSALVLLFGLGETGRCEHLHCLASTFGPRAPERLVLMREVASVLHQSGIGLVCRRDHAHVDSAIGRLRLLLTGNFSYLNLARSACETAIKLAQQESKLAQQESQAQETASKLAQQEKHNQELALIKASTAFRLANRLTNARRVMAPQGSLRTWLAMKLLQALRVCKAGVKGVAIGSAKKVFGRHPRPVEEPAIPVEMGRRQAG